MHYYYCMNYNFNAFNVKKYEKINNYLIFLYNFITFPEVCNELPE